MFPGDALLNQFPPPFLAFPLERTLGPRPLTSSVLKNSVLALHFYIMFRICVRRVRCRLDISGLVGCWCVFVGCILENTVNDPTVLREWSFPPYLYVGFIHYVYGYLEMSIWFSICIINRPPLWSSGQSFWLQIQRSRVRSPALPDFLSPREVN